ncbi:MAG TPA: hypothetical protein VNY34_01245, partial [Solirubrobacteraceae bacterium]|nr:hypothetical protein [Solirubrobacteraceae bacterium]
MGEVRWSEELNGWLSKSQTDFNQAMLEGQRDKQFARLSLKLAVRDIAGFIAAEPPRAEVTEGELSGSGIGDQLRVTWGEFDLLAPSTELIDHLHLRMRYRLNLHGLGGDFRLRGFKLVENDPGYDSWSDTSTLFFRLYEHSSWPTEGSSPEQERRQMEEAWEEAPELEPGLWASGVMEISPGGFAREVRSFFTGIRGGGYTGLADVLRYGVFFGEGLLKAYAGAPIPDGRPSFPVDRPRAPWDPEPAGPTPPPARSGGGAAPGAGRAGRWAPIPERREESGDRFALEREVVHFE